MHPVTSTADSSLNCGLVPGTRTHVSVHVWNTRAALPPGGRALYHNACGGNNFSGGVLPT